MHVGLVTVRFDPKRGAMDDRPLTDSPAPKSSSIRFAPPLVTSKDDLSAALDLIIPVLNRI
jgi:4-aminobutyrate aminotransferase-like enzyme